MKLYTGDRTIDGIQVTVDGAVLEPRTELEDFGGLGFEWPFGQLE